MLEFNKVSNESYFIKNLLYSTFLPLLRTVSENDYIIRDRLYIYKCSIIKCTSSGYIPVKNSNLNVNEYPECLLRKTDDERIRVGQIYYYYLGDDLRKIVGAAGDSRSPIAEGWYEQNIASFKVIGEYYFGERNDKFCRNFLSSSEGYDYKTHEKLGQYLRNLRDMYGLNLMPLYNCFSNQPLKNIHITLDSVEKTSQDYNTKVFKVPIRFNTDYTICMENVGMTTFAPAFIHHGTLMKLNNNRFGNDVDTTNKYIKLNHGDVIHHEPNLRFKNPIKLRFNNVPMNKVIHYSEYAYTELTAQYDPQYYRLNSSAEHAYQKSYTPDAQYIVDYDISSLASHKGVKVTRPGYIFTLGEFGYSLMPDDDLYPDDDLIIPAGGFETIQITEDDFTGNEDNYFLYDSSTHSFTQCQSGDTFDSDATYWYRSEVYESINPSIGTFEEVSKSYKKCPEDETFFNKNIFDNNKTKYYTYDSVDNVYVQCEESDTYDPATIYYYVNTEKQESWYEFVDGEFVPSEDTYIKPDKTYYKKDMTEVPITYNYDITEDNCCMYDYIEDELYLLIQVPSSFDSNIIILEGDYVDIAKEKYYDDSKFELFSNARLDYLFTKNLILMETNTKKIRPCSPTLIQFLLWNAICSLDSINNDMDRLAMTLVNMSLPGFDLQYVNNYWHDRYRESVFTYANDFPKKYIRDNLGYVTTDIERIIYQGEDFADSPEDMSVYSDDDDELI